MLDTPEMLIAALDYAHKGWPVFPVNPADKRALIREWQKAASTDEAQIRQWWGKWPKAMIGSLQGANGCFAIDLDIVNKDTGEVFEPEDLKAALEEDAGPLPVTRVAETGSGGWHIYLTIPEGATVPRRIRRLPQIDICGERGYTILPPSQRVDGKTYRWLTDAPIAMAPDSLVQWISAGKERPDATESDTPPVATRALPPSNERVDEARRKYALAALDRQTQDVARMGSGGRNQKLNDAALALGHLVGAGILSEGVVRAALLDAADVNGLVKDDGRKSVLDTIASGLRAGMSAPADLHLIGARAGSARNDRASARLQSPLTPPPLSSGTPAPSEAGEREGAAHMGASAEHDTSGVRGESWEQRKALRRWRMNARCAKFPLTDLGNGQRFVERYGRNFLYVEQWGWLAWDGRRWNTSDADAILNRAVHATIKAIAGEAKALRLLSEACDDDEAGDLRLAFYRSGEGDADQFFDPVVDVKKGDVIYRSDRISGWCLASQSNSHVTCIARLAQAYLTATPDKFNADLMAMNVANGTLHFAKRADGEDYVSFTRHKRADMMTRLADVVFDPKATCPVYDAFLARVQPDEKMRQHLHVWAGVSLTALQVAKLSFWYGKGRNGKSTAIDAWAHVIGEYSQTIPIESFLDQGRSRRGGEASPDIASLPDVRQLRTSEPEKGSQLAEGLIKLVTGGEPLRARHLNRDFFEFRPVFKLTMQGNYRPNVSGTDEGFWRRMLLVPWNVTISEEEVDPLLPDKLKAEASGILNRLLDGLRVYLDKGLVLTDEIISATADYRDDSDPIGRFLKECTAPGGTAIDAETRKPIEARVAGKEFYETYVAWAKAMGEKPWSPKGFSKGLQDHGIRRLKSSGIFYLGIAMTARAEDFEGQEIEALNDKKDKKSW